MTNQPASAPVHDHGPNLSAGAGCAGIGAADRVQPRLAPWLTLLAVVFAARVALAAAHPLFETEAYYWLWSRRLEAGYFDHPPMLAWLIRLFDAFGPPHSLAARLPSLVLHLLVTVMLYALTRNLFAARPDARAIGLRAALLFNVIPINSIAAIQCQPDAPLIFFWIATVTAFERALATRRPGWWLAAGLAAGGALLSKFHGVALVGSLLLYLIAAPAERRWLRTPWPWLAMVLALAVYSPNFFWNARHEWLTYRFQFMRPGSDVEFQINNPISVLAFPALYLTPWVYVLCVRQAWRGLRRRAGDDPAERSAFAERNAFAQRNAFAERSAFAFCAWTSAPLFVFFLLVSLRTEIKLHWPAPAFLMLIPALAAAIEGWPARRRRAFLAVPAAFTLLVYGYFLYPLPLSRANPGGIVPRPWRLDPGENLHRDYALRTFGWPELGAALRRELARTDAEAPTFIIARRFDRAATAAFWAGRPELAFVPDPGPGYKQSSRAFDPRGFLAWEYPFLKPGAHAIFVRERDSRSQRRRDRRLLEPYFERVGDPIFVDAAWHGHVLRRWELLPCYGWKSSTLMNRSPEERRESN